MKNLNFTLSSTFILLTVLGCNQGSLEHHKEPGREKNTKMEHRPEAEQTTCYRLFESKDRTNLIDVAVEFAKVASHCSPQETELILLNEVRK